MYMYICVYMYSEGLHICVYMYSEGFAFPPNPSNIDLT